MSGTIHVSQGLQEYRGGTITDDNGADITAATVEVAVGQDLRNPPVTGWGPPDTDESLSPASRKVAKLIDATVDAGVWCVWARVTDSPEKIPERLTQFFTID